MIADVLSAYAVDVAENRSTASNIAYNLGNLAAWWGTKTADEATTRNCRAYAKTKTAPAASADLKYLQAALRHWHVEYAPFPAIPKIWRPNEGSPRQRWLTPSEAARLLRAARRIPHLARMIILGLRTGSRPGVCKAVEWSWIDLERGLMYRRPPGVSERGNKRTPPVRLGRKMIAHLRRWKRMDGDHCKWVVHYGGRPVDDPHTSWNRAIERAGLSDDVTPHVLRHTRATWLLQARVDPWEAAGSLGMSLRTLLRVYGHHAPTHQGAASEV